MFKKFLTIIIGLILLLLISFAIIHEVSSADILDTCEYNKLNEYLKLEKDANGNLIKYGDGYKNLMTALNKSDGLSNDIKIRVAFENAREMYHDTVKCVFDIATYQILGSAGGAGSNVTKNDLTGLDQLLDDLNDVDKACSLTENGKLKDIINRVSPSYLVPHVLDAYNNYTAFINELLDVFLIYPPDIRGSSLALGEAGDRYLKMQSILENEIQDSIVALDSAFIGLKEMRLAFVMHVRFQCWLKNLKFYQQMTKNIRSIVSVIPGMIEDASMHK